jgi:hypothetical protein
MPEVSSPRFLRLGVGVVSGGAADFFFGLEQVADGG